jgi:hypothetical protein
MYKFNLTAFNRHNNYKITEFIFILQPEFQRDAKRNIQKAHKQVIAIILIVT